VLTTLGRRIRALTPTVHSLVDTLWDEGLRDGQIDWASAMANRLPPAMVAHLIGLTESDVPQLLTWAYDSTEILGGVVTADRLRPLVTSAAELAGYPRADLVRARTNPREDLLGVLAHACNASELSEDVATLVLVQLVGAGGESTAGLIGGPPASSPPAPDFRPGSGNNPHSSTRSSTRRFVSRPSSAGITGTCLPTPRSAAPNCPPVATCSCCGVRPTGIRPCSSVRTR
jgi:hypothetical protein